MIYLMSVCLANLCILVFLNSYFSTFNTKSVLLYNNACALANQIACCKPLTY